MDVLRVDVAQVCREELFAWPGEEGFSDRGIAEMDGAGMLVNGVFSLHVRTLFVNDVASKCAKEGVDFQRFLLCLVEAEREGSNTSRPWPHR